MSMSIPPRNHWKRISRAKLEIGVGGRYNGARGLISRDITFFVLLSTYIVITLPTIATEITSSLLKAILKNNVIVFTREKDSYKSNNCRDRNQEKRQRKSIALPLKRSFEKSPILPI